MTNVRHHLWIFLWLLACETTAQQPLTSVAVRTPQGAEEAETSPAIPAATPAPLAPPPAPAPEEIGSRTFWVNPSSEAAQASMRLQSTQPREAGWLKQLAEQPTAVWFTAKTKDPQEEAARLAQAVAGSSAYAVAVIQALPKRDCMRYETVGLAADAYRAWIENLVRGLGETPIYWILEPEAPLAAFILQTAAQRLHMQNSQGVCRQSAPDL